MTLGQLKNSLNELNGMAGINDNDDILFMIRDGRLVNVIEDIVPNGYEVEHGMLWMVFRLEED